MSLTTIGFGCEALTTLGWGDKICSFVDVNAPGCQFDFMQKIDMVYEFEDKTEGGCC